MKNNVTAKSGVVVAVLAFALLVAGCGGTKTPAPSSQSGTSTTTQSSSATTTTGAPVVTSNVALTVPVSGSGGFNYTQGSYLEGFEFTAKNPLSITKLGAYDSNLSALSNGTETFATVPVALYDISTHKQLTSVNVTASDPPTGVYRYATLSSPIALSGPDTYAVVWVSLSNFYVASPTLIASDVNPAINYLAMAGYGPGGLTTTSTMVEPDWFYTMSANGLRAINYDLGPNFIFKSSH